MQEVDVLAVDLGGELGDLVEAGLVDSPVVAAGPVLDQVDEVVLVHAVVPADAGDLVGPAGAGQSVSQVVEVSLRDVDTERLHVGHGLDDRSHSGQVLSSNAARISQVASISTSGFSDRSGHRTTVPESDGSAGPWIRALLPASVKSPLLRLSLRRRSQPFGVIWPGVRGSNP